MKTRTGFCQAAWIDPGKVTIQLPRVGKLRSLQASLDMSDGQLPTAIDHYILINTSDVIAFGRMVHPQNYVPQLIHLPKWLEGYNLQTAGSFELVFWAVGTPRDRNVTTRAQLCVWYTYEESEPAAYEAALWIPALAAWLAAPAADPPGALLDAGNCVDRLQS